MPACTAGEKFQQALQLIQTIQEHFVAFSEKEESASVAGAKAATVLSLAVLKKIASGKKPSSFDAEDWKDLAHAVSQHAVLLEGAQYSVFVFQLYEKYIRASAASMQGVASDKIVETIAKLADELHEKESLFQSRDPFICGRHRFVFSQLKSYLLIIKQQSCRYGICPYRKLALSLMEFSFAFSPFNSCFPLLPQTTCFLPETDRTPFHRSAQCIVFHHRPPFERRRGIYR